MLTRMSVFYRDVTFQSTVLFKGLLEPAEIELLCFSIFVFLDTEQGNDAQSKSHYQDRIDRLMVHVEKLDRNDDGALNVAELQGLGEHFKNLYTETMREMGKPTFER